MKEKVNLTEKLSHFSAHWSPKTVGKFNDYDIRVVKVRGEFVWHKHDDTNDFFMVLKGKLTIRLRGGEVVLGPDDLYVVPKGVEHCTYAEVETHVLLIEPVGTPNTGDGTTAAKRQEI